MCAVPCRDSAASEVGGGPHAPAMRRRLVWAGERSDALRAASSGSDEGTRGAACGEASWYLRNMDHYTGTLLGLAVGNALGIPAESQHKAAVLGRYPEARISVLPGEATAPWDDDLAQAFLLGEALLKKWNPDAYGQDLVRWLRENGRGVGGHTRRVLGSLERGNRNASELIWEYSNREAAGNGAVMRCAPIALRYNDMGNMVGMAVDSARVTHFDPRCLWSTAAVVVTISAALQNYIMGPEVIASTLKSFGAPEVVLGAIMESEGELEDFELDSKDRGFTLKTMKVGLWAARQPNFGPTLIDVVSQGGDTDTNAAVAGAVLGAKLGRAAIPAEWLANINGVDRLEDLAARLYAARTPTLV